MVIPRVVTVCLMMHLSFRFKENLFSFRERKEEISNKSWKSKEKNSLEKV